jgi:pimeloyl-ACP methyl ester carboxylesterase
MALLFKDDLQDEFGAFGFGYTPYGGVDFGEMAAVAEAVGDGDDAAFCDAWVVAGDRHVAEAEAVLARGHTTSARELFLRASCCFALSYRPLFGEPVNPRLTASFGKQIRAFDRGLGLFDPPIEPLRIPFEGTTLPAYLVPATGRATDTRPLVIFTNGYDATVTDMYFASAVAASRRGYHCLIFDGPGQGEMLILRSMRLRPDWETVVEAVVDFALTLPNVDPHRIALSGWSLGGYLAVRAASGEHRLSACIADPGLFSMASVFGQFAKALGVPEAAAAGGLGSLDDATLDKIWAGIAANRQVRWSIVQRGYWVQGVSTLREFFRSCEQYTLQGRVESVRCPTLLTVAEKDGRAASAQEVYDALRCPKTLMRFTAAEGAGDHCEMQNRSLLNLRVLDWLDPTLQAVKA